LASQSTELSIKYWPLSWPDLRRENYRKIHGKSVKEKEKNLRCLTIYLISSVSRSDPFDLCIHCFVAANPV